MPHVNNGDSDVSPEATPSQFLLIRALEPTVTEELLARGMAKLYKPSSPQPSSAPAGSSKGNAKILSTTVDANLGAKEGTLRRVLLIRDRKSNESWRYGFAEYATIDVCTRTPKSSSKAHLCNRMPKLPYPALNLLTSSPSPQSL